MKPLTEKTNLLLKENDLIEKVKHDVEQEDEAFEYQGLTLTDAFERFCFLHDVIMNSIESGSYDEISNDRKLQIHRILNSINKIYRDPHNFILQVEQLYDNVSQSGLLNDVIKDYNFQKEFKELTKLKRSYTSYINKLKESQNDFQFISKKRSELNKLLVNIQEGEGKIEDHLANIKGLVDQINENLASSNSLKENIDDVRADVEEKKLSIETFAKNINEYKSKINTIQRRAEEVISKDEEIKSLITNAREALQLNSTLGISAAFSAQYDKSNDPKVYRKWIRGAVLLLIVAIGLTVWAISGYGIKNPDSINTIVGRVVAVGISIAGAAFCAKQYVRQKNIAEDYAYKATLSKSIVAFADEIAASDNDNNEFVGGYLTRVLEEIHRDPLRSRKEVKESKWLSKEDMEKLEKLANLIKK